MDMRLTAHPGASCVYRADAYFVVRISGICISCARSPDRFLDVCKNHEETQMSQPALLLEFNIRMQ